MIDWNVLHRLTRDVPIGLNRSAKKEPINKETRKKIYLRDSNKCQMCGRKGKYGNPQYGIAGILSIHHIIPNGTADPANLITLCDKCHKVVHLLLYLEGKWRYVP